MESLLFLVVVIVLMGVVSYLIYKIQSLSKVPQQEVFHERLDRLNQAMSQNLNLVTQNVLQQLNEITKQVNSRLKENTEQLNRRLQESSQLLERSHQSIGQRLDTAAKVVTMVTNKLSKLEEANQKIFDVGKDIAKLQDILRAPKLRGGLGELFLGDLLAQIFPRQNYELQYTFKTGVKVDAVIRTHSDLLVPVDAKFPLENFKKTVESDTEETKEKYRKEFLNDVKKHVSDIASKYILPDEGTIDYALMYIPAENVYYETIIKHEDEKDINSFALKKRVFPVSPNTFYLFLQSILMGLHGQKIEKEAKTIWMHLSRLKNDFERFEAQFSILGKHLMNAKNSYDSGGKQLDRFGQKLLSGNEQQPLAIEQSKDERVETGE